MARLSQEDRRRIDALLENCRRLRARFTAVRLDLAQRNLRRRIHSSPVVDGPGDERDAPSQQDSEKKLPEDDIEWIRRERDGAQRKLSEQLAAQQDSDALRELLRRWLLGLPSIELVNETRAALTAAQQDSEGEQKQRCVRCDHERATHPKGSCEAYRCMCTRFQYAQQLVRDDDEVPCPVCGSPLLEDWLQRGHENCIGYRRTTVAP